MTCRVLGSITAKFVGYADTLQLKREEKWQHFVLEAAYDKNKFVNAKKLELHISFTSGQPDKILILKRYKFPGLEIPGH